jgi:hypothetical protein
MIIFLPLQTYKSPELELRMFDHGIACNVTRWHPV